MFEGSSTDPCNKEELRDLVATFVQQRHLETPSKDGRPGSDWYYSFMNRNETLSFKNPEHLQKARKDQRKPEVIYNFYKKLKEVVTKEKIDDAMFVFNADESGFGNDPSKIKAIGKRGKILSRISGGSGKESTSVLACVAADGIFPVNAEKFPENEFNPTDLKRFKEQQGKAAENDGIQQGEPEPETNDTEEAGVEQLQSIPSTSVCSKTNCITEASDIVAVFSSAIAKTLNVDSNRYSAEPKKVTPRLKQARYGEVLTTAEVVERLKEAERQKDEKTARKNRPRLKNNSNEKQKRKRKKDSKSEEENEVVPYDENSDGEINQN
ncbi:hypothetical protein JTB14_018700 [Gonioctena quinquepunctata]|nr:hypothetical protein JTB14_018700 [Gonioctena quinquepunctata]